MTSAVEPVDVVYDRAYTLLVFEWDPAKARRNLTKHGIDFADAAIALEDELALTIEDPNADDERRFITLGLDPTGRLLAVVFTFRGGRVRLVSARAATRRERRTYEEG